MNWKEDIWKAWFGHHGGREAGTPHRTFITDAAALIPHIKKSTKQGKPYFLSVQPYRGRDQVYGLDKLFFDFDSTTNPPDLDKTWKETHHFATILKKYYSLTPLTVFSGRKGYHIYIWMWQVVKFRPRHEALAKTVYTALQQKLLQGLDYETLDLGVLGDTKRLARIPYTIHQETGLLCQPVSMNRHPLHIPSAALEAYRKHGIQEPFFRQVVEEAKVTQNLRVIKRDWQRSNSNIRYPKDSHLRPCIVEALEISLDEEYGHLMRLAIAVEHLNTGYTVDQIVPLFQTQHDFDLEKTRLMVEHAQKKGYKPRRRETIQRYGFCTGKSCSACIKALAKRGEADK